MGPSGTAAVLFPDIADIAARRLGLEQ